MQRLAVTDSANDPNPIILAFAELITLIVCHFFKIQHFTFCLLHLPSHIHPNQTYSSSSLLC